MNQLTLEQTQSISGGVIILIPPAVGFAAKVTGISLGIIASSFVTYVGLVSGLRSIFPSEVQGASHEGTK